MKKYKKNTEKQTNNIDIQTSLPDKRIYTRENMINIRNRTAERQAEEREDQEREKQEDKPNRRQRINAIYKKIKQNKHTENDKIQSIGNKLQCIHMNTIKKYNREIQAREQTKHKKKNNIDQPFNTQFKKTVIM